MQLLSVQGTMPSQNKQWLPSQPIPPSFIIQHEVIWNIPVDSLGQLSWFCLFTAPCAPPRWQGGRVSTLRISTAQQQSKHQYLISTILLNPKRSIILLLWRNSYLSQNKDTIIPTDISSGKLNCISFLQIENRIPLWRNCSGKIHLKSKN